MPRTVRSFAIVSICSIALVATPAGAAIRPGRLGIGDSMMLGAKEELVAEGSG
jgi:hypothetical protein